MASYDFDKEKQDYTTAFYELLLSVMSTGELAADISAPRLTLIGTVKLKIDELQTKKEGVHLITTASETGVLDMYINGLLDESAKHILQTAPLHIIETADGLSAGITVDSVDGTIGVITLPADYLRFVSLQMGTWRQEVTAPILTTNPKYRRQKYAATRGGIAKPVAVLNSARVITATQVQIDSAEVFVNSEGEGIIYCAGLGLPIYGATAAEAVSTFEGEHASSMLAVGVVLTSDITSLLTFTAAVAGVPFSSPWFTARVGGLYAVITQTQPNIAASTSERILEYYSITSGEAHEIKKFLYIANVGADYIQSDLTDALTWLAASKVLTVMSDKDGADRAMAQIELSYKNLL